MLDLFWGYKEDTDGRDQDLTNLIYPPRSLTSVADMALKKLSDMARSDMKLFDAVQTAEEQVFMFNPRTPSSRSYTFDTFYQDVPVYTQAMEPFVLHTVSR